jgi:hypothetical protein
MVALNGWAWAFIIISTVSTILAGAQHGQPETGKTNVGLTFFCLIIEVVILYFAGFWTICWQAIVFTVLYAICLIFAYINHGKDKTGKNNFIASLLVNGGKVAMVVTALLI